MIKHQNSILKPVIMCTDSRSSFQMVTCKFWQDPLEVSGQEKSREQMSIGVAGSRGGPKYQ